MAPTTDIIQLLPNVTVERQYEPHDWKVRGNINAPVIITGEDGYAAYWGPSEQDVLDNLKGMYTGTRGKYAFTMWVAPPQVDDRLTIQRREPHGDQVVGTVLDTDDEIRVVQVSLPGEVGVHCFGYDQIVGRA